MVVVPAEFSEMVAASQTIVHGRVVDVRSYETGRSHDDREPGDRAGRRVDQGAPGRHGLFQAAWWTGWPLSSSDGGRAAVRPRVTKSSCSEGECASGADALRAHPGCLPRDRRVPAATDGDANGQRRLRSRRARRPVAPFPISPRSPTWCERSRGSSELSSASRPSVVRDRRSRNGASGNRQRLHPSGGFESAEDSPGRSSGPRRACAGMRTTGLCLGSPLPVSDRGRSGIRDVGRRPDRVDRVSVCRLHLRRTV